MAFWHCTNQDEALSGEKDGEISVRQEKAKRSWASSSWPVADPCGQPMPCAGQAPDKTTQVLVHSYPSSSPFKGDAGPEPSSHSQDTDSTLPPHADYKLTDRGR